MKSTWKDHERRIAQRLGGERIAVSDRRSSTDVLHPLLSVECKHRKSLPRLLHDAMGQARAAHPEKIGTIILHELNKNSDDDYVCVRLVDFEKLIESYQDMEYLRTTKPDMYEQAFSPHQSG